MLDVYKKNRKIKLQTKGGVRTQKGEESVYSTAKQWVIINSPGISSLVAWNKEIEMKWGKKAPQLTVRCLACFHLANHTDHRMSQGAALGHLPPSWGSPHWFATQPWLFHMFRCHRGNFSLGKIHNKKIQLCFNRPSVNP